MAQQFASTYMKENEEVDTQNRQENNQKSFLLNNNRAWNNPVHGNIYQLKVLMLFLYRGISRKYSFRLGTEVKEAGKFDDLVFEYIQDNKKICRLLQAKHKIDESKKITVDNLLTENNGDYNLVKYFYSYQACKGDNFFKNSLIKDVTICTNIDFDFESLKKANVEVKRITKTDDILDVKSDQKQPKRYMFTNSVIPKLKQKLHACRVWCNASDEEIENFLQHLVFAVNQPNEEELGAIVKNEIGKELDSITTENLYNKLFVRMLDWMKGRSNFMSYNEGEELFEELKKRAFVWFNVQDPVKSFTGRVEQLKNVHDLLQSNSSKMICVSGLGGIGKSELARKYVAEQSQHYDNQIVWVNAENYQSLADSFCELANDKLSISTKNVDGKEKTITSLVAEVYRHFSNGKSLFVFDNAEQYSSRSEFDSGISRFLPSLPNDCQKPYMIITSRNKKWPESIKMIFLEVFSEQEAIEFISRSLQLKTNEEIEYVIDLANKLQFLPLGLQQAVAYILAQSDTQENVDSKFRIRQYLKEFNKKSEKVLNFEFPGEFDNAYTKTVYTTWNVTLDAITEKMNGQNALVILHIIAYLLPDNIPLELLLIIKRNEYIMESAIDLLQQFSLITVHHKAVSVHRLVQQITRMKLKKINKEEETLEIILNAIQRSDVNLKNLDHFLAVWKHSVNYINLIETYHPVSEFIMKALISCARNEEVHQMGMEILTRMRHMSPDNIEAQNGLVNVKICLANAFLKQGKYEKALFEFTELLRMPKTWKERFAPEIIDIHCDMGRTLERLGKYDEALESYQKALKVMKYTRGENNQDARSIKHDAASILMQKGLNQEALTILQEVYDVDKTILGDDHELTLATRNNIAKIYHEQFRSEEALRMFQDIYAIQKTRLPENHPDLIIARHNVASSLDQQGKYAAALEIYEDILRKACEVHGETHPDVMTIQCCMARTLDRLGKSKKALKILEQLFIKQIDILGSDHPDTLLTQFEIANMRRGQDGNSKTLMEFQKLLKTSIKVLGDDHTVTLNTRQIIAEIYLKAKKYHDVVNQLLQILKVQERTLGNNHRNTLMTKKSIDIIYSQINECEENTLENTRIENTASPNSNPFVAVQTNNINTLKQLFEGGLDINKPDNSSRTLLHHAANADHLEIVKYLLGNGADLTQTTDKGNTALHIAVSRDYFNVADELLKNVTYNKLKAFVDAKTTMTGTTALHIASKSGSDGMVKLLLSRGAHFDIRNKRNQRPVDVSESQTVIRLLKNLENIFELGASGKLQCHDILKELALSEYCAFMNARNRSGCNFIQVVVANNHSTLVNLLRELVVERSFYTFPWSDSKLYLNNLLPLAEKTTKCRTKAGIECAKKLVAAFKKEDKRILDPNIMGIEDMLWLLHHKNFDSAVFVELAKLVIETHVKLLLKSTYTMKLLEAAKCNDLSSVKKSITEGTNVNVKDQGGWTALHYATNANNAKIVEFLIDEGACVNSFTHLGKNTSLHIAVNKGYLEIVKLLLERDTSSEFINARTEAKGSTAVHIAAKNGCLDIIMLLLKNGAIYYLKNKDGQVPIDLANDEPIKKLLKLIREIFDDAKNGRIGILKKLKNLTIDEYTMVRCVRNEDGHLITDVSAMKGHRELSQKIINLSPPLR